MDAPRYLLYTRKSVGKEGVERQRTATTEHIASDGGVIVREYTDTDSTAFFPAGAERAPRPDFDALLDALRADPSLRVAAWHSDRLARSSSDAELLIAAMQRGAGIVETYRAGRYDLRTANGRKHFVDDANAGRYEVDHAIERMVAKQQELAREGRYHGGVRPFGYTADGMARLPPEDEAIIRASEAVLGGMTVAAVARSWNDQGLLTTKGGQWTGSQVRKVLMRARNAGRLIYQGQDFGDAAWPALVDPEIWEGLCALLGDKARYTGGGPRKYLLSGLLVCGECGGPMTSHNGVGRPRPGHPPRVVYWCPRYRHIARRVDAVDEYVSAMVRGRLRLPDAAGALAPASAGEAASITAQLARLRERGDRAAADYNAELLTGRQVKLINDEIAAEHAELTARKAELTRRDALSALAGGDADEIWESLSLGQKRAVISTLLRVTVLRAPRGRPDGWRIGMPYFDPESVRLDWL